MLVLILGLPGTGKSTLARRLLARLNARACTTNGANHAGATYLHPGKHARAEGMVKTEHATRAELLALPQLTDSFLKALDTASSKGIVIVDGFPRTREQAKALAAKPWQLTIIHLAFPQGQEMELSVARQERRVKEDGVTVERSKLEEQTRIGLEHDQPAIDELLATTKPLLTVDALLSPDEVEAAVFNALSPLLPSE